MKKVLIVDDDPDIAEVVSALLSRNGFEVSTYDTGYRAVEVIKERNPDLVLLDINLPGKQGTDICRELKQISNIPPILLFSAHANERNILAECKADGFVSKPFDIKQLVDMVSRHAN